MDSEIITRTGTAETEPSLTLSQLRALLQDAAALERAQRPIILRGPEPYPTPATPTQPPQGAAGSILGPRFVERLFVRSEVVFFTSLGVLGTSLASAAVAGSGAPLLFAVPALLSVFVSLGLANRDLERRGSRAKHGVDHKGRPVTEAARP